MAKAKKAAKKQAKKAGKKASKKSAKKATKKATSAASKRTSAKPAAGSGKATHIQTEDQPWTINIGDHPKRSDSPQYIKARKMMQDIVKSTQPWYLGAEPYQDHHGGGLWVKDEEGWLLVKNLAGIEWSAQFCADPAKVDYLRQNAKRLYAKFPLSAPAFQELGFDLDTLLNTPIQNADDVANWTDSICNASLPLPPGRHTGVVTPQKGPDPDPPHVDGGVHHYPTPITDIELFKHDDFVLWVTDSEGQPAAVVPVGRRGSGDSRVEVVNATPGTKLHKQFIRTHSKGEQLILSGKHPMARQAFKKQQ